MNKLLPVLVMLTVLSIAPITGASAAQVEFSGPAQLQYYDAQIDVLIPRLQAFEATYYAVNGRYFQALDSHNTAPDVPTVPDFIEASPTDQPETLALFWEGIAELPDALAWAFRIDTYSGPDGDGYVLIIETVVDGETWSRSVNCGPEEHRSTEWTYYPADPKGQ